MKSIKEKAEEYTNGFFWFQKKSIPHPSIQRMCNESFVDGANYVLDEVESLMKDVSDEFPRFQQGTIIHGKLIKLLEQLKK